MGASRASDGRGASQRRSRERREQLLQAALTLLERDGAKALTHRAVSEEAGLPSATAGYYFPGIDDLLAEALARHATVRIGWLRSQMDAIEALGTTPLEVARGTAARLAAGNAMISVADYQVYLVAARHPEFRPVAAAIRRDLEELTATYLSRIGVTNLAHATRAHLALVDGFGLQQLAFGPGAVDVAAATDAFSALFHYHRLTDAEREQVRAPLDEPFPDAPLAQPADAATSTRPAVQGRGASQQRSRERREQLLAAAIPLLEAGGAKAVTHRSVSQAAGLPPATAGYYFPAIGQLLTEAVDFHVRGRLANLSRMMEPIRAVVSSPLDLVERTSRGLAQGASGIDTTHFELFVEAARNPEFRPIAADTRRAFTGFAVDQLVLAGVRDVARTSHVYLAYVDGLALQRLAFGGGDDADVALMVDSLVGLVHYFRAPDHTQTAIRESLRP